MRTRFLLWKPLVEDSQRGGGREYVLQVAYYCGAGAVVIWENIVNIAIVFK